MGHLYTTLADHPDNKPVAQSLSKYDPMYGFANGRKEREMKVTNEEMESAGVPIDKRDYCAHHYINFMKCRREKFPWVAGCKHELHLYEDCEFEDYVLRMKEFEREKRLMLRDRRKQASAERELLE